LFVSQRQGIPDRAPDGLLRGTPQHIDAGDMDDRLERQLAGRGKHGAAEGNCPLPSHFLERRNSASSLDRSRNALGKKQPPWNDVAVPRVDDYVNGLIE
jgi:hypothetical protein